MKKILLALVAISSVSVANAQSFYVGGSIGISENKLWKDPQDTGARTDDKRDLALKGLVGYNIDKTFAVEVSYTDLGENKATYATGESVKSSVNAATLAAKANLGKFDQVTPFVKVGVTRLSNEESYNGGSLKNSKNNFYWALGADYDLTKQISLRAEYENYGKAGSFDSATISSNATGVESSALSLGVIYKF
jgi:OOP family OmpA-OmpF porin